jgi:hypothetical protein
MDEEKAILLIVVGVALIGASFVIKNFYGANGIFAAMLSDKSIPTWQGRLIFWLVGGMMILGGLIFFIPIR